MGELTICEKIREWLACACFRAFLKLNKTTDEQYWDEVYYFEKLRREDPNVIKP